MFGSVWIAFGIDWTLFGLDWIVFGFDWMRLDDTRAIVRANQQPILTFEVEHWKLKSLPPRRRGLNVLNFVFLTV
jgi:hypothetical protein